MFTKSARFRGLVVFGLVWLCVWAGCRRAPQGVRIDPALASMVPSDTVMLLGVNVESLRNTALYKNLLASSASLRINEFAERTGFNPSTDLWELLVAANRTDAVVMARGKFSPQGLEPKPAVPGVQRMSYKGYTLLGDEKSAVLFVNATTAIAGSTPVLHSIVDRRATLGEIPAELNKRIQLLPPSSQIWAVAVGGLPVELIPKSGNLSNLGRALAGMEVATLSVDLQSGLTLAAEADYRDERTARKTGDALKALLGIARLTTSDRERDLLQAMDSISVTQVGPAIKFTAQMPQDLVDKLTVYARKLQER